MSSHKTDWILSKLPLLALSCLSYRIVSGLMNELEEECLCLREISIDVNKLLAVLMWPIYFFILHFVVACLLLNPLFLLMLLLLIYLLFIPFFILMLLYFCLFFVYYLLRAFVYHFKKTISIFVTIFFQNLSKGSWIFYWVYISDV